MSENIKEKFTEVVPNLDAIEDDREMAGLCIDFKNIEALCHMLATYCEAKSDAIHWRKEGKINTAVMLEAKCDRIYKQLPHWAKSW